MVRRLSQEKRCSRRSWLPLNSSLSTAFPEWQEQPPSLKSTVTGRHLTTPPYKSVQGRRPRWNGLLPRAKWWSHPSWRKGWDSWGAFSFFFLSFRRSMNLKNVVKCWWAPSFLLSVQWKDSNCHKHQDFMFFSQSPALRILYSICSSLLCEIYIACILYWALSVQYNLSSPLKIIVAICLFYLFVFSLWNINML